MPGRTAAVTTLLAVCLMTACNSSTPETTTAPEPAPQAPPAQSASEPATPAPGPAISPQVESAPATATQATGVIAAQPGPAGSTWNLTSAQVSGQILTLQLSVQTSSDRAVTMMRIPLDEISLIDDATSQSYSLLQEDNGRYMAAPLNSGGQQLAVSAGSRDETVVVWLKYPAPPAGSDRVSLTLPQVGPFDGIPVSR